MEGDKLKELRDRYGKSEHGNFYIHDTIGVPHPYCIGARHLAWVSDHHHGILNEYAIETAEKNGAHCEVPRCNLSFAEHKQALLVACRDHMTVLDADGHKTSVPNPELETWLLACKDKAIEDKYEGFAFLDLRDKAVAKQETKH